MPRFCRTVPALAALIILAGAAAAQDREAAAPLASPTVTVPNFWDPGHRDKAPDLPATQTIRFLTEAQNPPFSFIGADGLPTGFHVELARAICIELDVACTIQTLRWDLLLDGIEDDRGDALIAGLEINAETHARFDFSHQYLSRPARFVMHRKTAHNGMLPADLAGMKVAVVRGTAHEAYLRVFFPATAVLPFDDAETARKALVDGDVDALFGDGLNLSLWLNGATSERCCEFRGGPYTESHYFGQGFAIAVAPGNDRLREALDSALARVHASGAYAEIFIRYFPSGFY